MQSEVLRLMKSRELWANGLWGNLKSLGEQDDKRALYIIPVVELFLLCRAMI